MIYLQGVLYGITLALLIGPVFFALLRVSIERGFTSGAWMALGIALSESFVIALVAVGVAQLAETKEFQFYLGIVGGAMMLIFGIFPFLKKVKRNTETNNSISKKAQGYRLAIEGFLLNVLNPSVYLFWIGAVAFNSHLKENEMFSFFAGAITTVFVTDLIKAYLANYIRGYLTESVLDKVNKIAGAGLVCFAFWLFYSAFYGFKMPA
jgi:threonine/homoserine/homoserine lactone efflux protein